VVLGRYLKGGERSLQIITIESHLMELLYVRSNIEKKSEGSEKVDIFKGGLS